MITHTLTAAYVDQYPRVCDWIDARYEGAPDTRHITFVNTRIEAEEFEKRDLADWIAGPFTRPVVLVDLPENYGFLPAYFQGALHAPLHVVFPAGDTENAEAFAVEFGSGE